MEVRPSCCFALIDPFPQHFEHGEPNAARTSRCTWPESRRAGRVEAVRGILARGLRSRKEAVRHVPVYEILSPRWQDHPGNILGHTDCTHYGRVSNELVWKALIAAGEV